MNKLLKTEHLALFILGFFLFLNSEMPWYIFVGGMIAVDLFMIGYLINPKIGAIVYNLGHNYILVAILFILGLMLKNDALYFAGIVSLTHISLDRMLGFGLKYPDHFQHTHLNDKAFCERCEK